MASPKPIPPPVTRARRPVKSNSLRKSGSGWLINDSSEHSRLVRGTKAFLRCRRFLIAPEYHHALIECRFVQSSRLGFLWLPYKYVRRPTRAARNGRPDLRCSKCGIVWLHHVGHLESHAPAPATASPRKMQAAECGDRHGYREESGGAL